MLKTLYLIEYTTIIIFNAKKMSENITIEETNLDENERDNLMRSDSNVKLGKIYQNSSGN